MALFKKYECGHKLIDIMSIPVITAFQTAKNSRIKACNAEQDQTPDEISIFQCYFSILSK